MVFSTLMGAPFVATAKGRIQTILKEAELKTGHIFYELGCGDGLIVRTAVKEYKVHGKGIDINPVLIFYARIIAKLQKLTTIMFSVSNVLKISYHDADVIYLFLMPELIKKLEKQFKESVKEDALIISHGFKIKYFEPIFVKTVEDTPFPTYYYRMNRSKLI
jgi:SAM-dependent methyltransferase